MENRDLKIPSLEMPMEEIRSHDSSADETSEECNPNSVSVEKISDEIGNETISSKATVDIDTHVESLEEICTDITSMEKDSTKIEPVEDINKDEETCAGKDLLREAIEDMDTKETPINIIEDLGIEDASRKLVGSLEEICTEMVSIEKDSTEIELEKDINKDEETCAGKALPSEAIEYMDTKETPINIIEDASKKVGIEGSSEVCKEISFKEALLLEANKKRNVYLQEIMEEEYVDVEDTEVTSLNDLLMEIAETSSEDSEDFLEFLHFEFQLPRVNFSNLDGVIEILRRNMHNILPLQFLSKGENARRLLEVCKLCRQLGNQEHLAFLYRLLSVILQAATNFGNESILSSKNIEGVVATLEYGPKGIRPKQSYKYIFRKLDKLTPDVQITSQEVNNKIKHVYQLDYLLQNFFPQTKASEIEYPYLNILKTVNTMKKNILKHFLSESITLTAIEIISKCDTPKKYKGRLVSFLNECFNFLKELSLSYQQKFTEFHLNNGIADALVNIKDLEDEQAKHGSINLFKQLTIVSPTCMKYTILKQYDKEENVMDNIFKCIHKSQHDILTSMVMDIIEILIIKAVPNDTNDNFIKKFYQISLPVLLYPLQEYGETELTNKQTLHLCYLIDVLARMIEMKNMYILREIILNNNVLEHIIRIFEISKLVLKIKILKLLNLLLSANDVDYNEVVMSKNLLAPIYGALLENYKNGTPLCIYLLKVLQTVKLSSTFVRYVIENFSHHFLLPNIKML